MIVAVVVAVVAVRMMQMAIDQVVDVIAVPDRGMAAVRAVRVRMGAGVRVIA
ncbi:MAG: hypothetical protein V4764_04530 [Burkholderia sp.]